MTRRRIRSLETKDRENGVAAVSFTSATNTRQTARGKTMHNILNDGHWHVRTPSRAAAELLADWYGGGVEAWHKRQGWWIAHLETDRLDIWLPWGPEPADAGPDEQIQARVDSVLIGPTYLDYNQQTGLNERDCDGVTCIPGIQFSWGKGQGRPVPCICETEKPDALAALEDYDDDGSGYGGYGVNTYDGRWRKCKTVTTLRFSFPFDNGGHWTVTTRADGAAMRWLGQVTELAINQPTRDQAQAQLIMSAQSNGKNNWTDIDILSAYTRVQIAGGGPARAAAALAQGPAFMPALPSGHDDDGGDSGGLPFQSIPVDPSTPNPDDDIVDAELAEDDEYDDDAWMRDEPLTLDPEPLATAAPTIDEFGAAAIRVGCSGANAVAAASDYLESLHRPRRPKYRDLAIHEPDVANMVMAVMETGTKPTVAALRSFAETYDHA